MSAAQETREGKEPEPSPAEEQKGSDLLAMKDKEIAELTDTLKRLQADFENFKKRYEKDWNERVRLANHGLIYNLLAVLDSFDKALEDARKNDDPASLRQGLEGLRRQFVQTLQREGLKEISTSGRFDPFVHEALMSEQREDVEEGTILEVFQKGYALGQNTLRPAKVKVARKPEERGGEEVAGTNAQQAGEAASRNHDKATEER
ncbi:MAG: nucleotide exchange factor GrpE [Thermoplasmata archaeon]